MKVNTLQNSNDGVLSNIESRPTKGFTLSMDNPQLFSILSDKLYENKIQSIVRELSCNAVDAHVAAGTPDKPYLLEISGGHGRLLGDGHEEMLLNSQRYTNLDVPVEYTDIKAQNKSYHHAVPFFRIRDFGTGLSFDNVVDMYTSYGSSTKRHTNAFIGGFGIGSKSPFAYADMFTVISYFNGEKHTFMMSRENGFPTCTHISTLPTDEPNGLEISFLVSDSDWVNFNKEILCQHAASRVPPLLVGVVSPVQPKFHSELSSFSQGKIGKVLRKNPAVRYHLLAGITGNNGGVRQGDVFYRDGAIMFSVRYILERYLIDVPVGTFSPTASREKFENTDDNAQLYAQISDAILEQEIEDATQDLTTLVTDFYTNEYVKPTTKEAFEKHLLAIKIEDRDVFTGDIIPPVNGEYLSCFLSECYSLLLKSYDKPVAEHLTRTHGGLLGFWAVTTGDTSFDTYRELFKFATKSGTGIYSRGEGVKEIQRELLSNAWEGTIFNKVYTSTGHWLAVVEDNARKAAYYKTRLSKGLRVGVDGQDYMYTSYLTQDLGMDILKVQSVAKSLSKSIKVNVTSDEHFNTYYRPFFDQWGYDYIYLEDVPAWTNACNSLSYAQSKGQGQLITQGQKIQITSTGKTSWEVLDRKGIMAWEKQDIGKKSVYYVHVDNSDNRKLQMRSEYQAFWNQATNATKGSILSSFDYLKPFVITDATRAVFLSTFPKAVNLVDLFFRGLDEFFVSLPEDELNYELLKTRFISRAQHESFWCVLQSNLGKAHYTNKRDYQRRKENLWYAITDNYSRKRVIKSYNDVANLPKTNKRLQALLGVKSEDVALTLKETYLPNLVDRVQQVEKIFNTLLPDFTFVDKKSLYIAMASAYYGGAKAFWRKLRVEFKNLKPTPDDGDN